MQLWQTKNNSFDKKLHDGPVVATLGNFDGVHAGHRRLITEAVNSAKDRDIPSILITFDPHPGKILSPGPHSCLLMTLPQKLSVMESLGVEGVWIIPFSREFSELAPDAFLSELRKKICPVELHVGQAFRFGRNRAGDISTLQTWGNSIGCQVHAHAYAAPDGGALSSSRIRQLLADGNVDMASALLGAPFRLTGAIVEGDRRGRSLGFPTANLKWEQEYHPAAGVYLTKVHCQSHLEEPAPGLTNIGIKPTFGSQCLTIETHLPGMDIDLYGKRIELDFLHRIRGEEKFDCTEALKCKIAEDIEKGLKWWEARAK
ncbi:MAG: riboflavin biosynthesis protein RibF [Holophagaceae bacterium]|nr:riboflavin biosynthesis protein RibF [Holophagaceae bacterium]